MEIKNESHTEKAKNPHVFIEFGGPAHETEYVFTLHPTKYSEAQNLPREWEDELIKLLGEGWSVMNRGARIEIMPPDLTRTAETDSKLKDAIKSIIGSDYEFSEIS